MLSGEVRDSPPPSLAIYRSGEAALPKTARIMRINCRQPCLLLTDGPNVTKRPDLRAHTIITAQQPKGRDAPSHLPPTSPTTRAAAPPEKARPPRTTAATTVVI
jgi:hypothetical protein